MLVCSLCICHLLRFSARLRAFGRPLQLYAHSHALYAADAGHWRRSPHLSIPHMAHKSVGCEVSFCRTMDSRLPLTCHSLSLVYSFKLHAPFNTTVQASCVGNVLTSLVVEPADRKQDIVLVGCTG